MPEFVMEGRDHAARNESQFVLGFIEAMFFTETGSVSVEEWINVDEDEKYSDGSLPCDVGYSDIHPESLAAIRRDCEAWQTKHADLLNAAYERGYDETQAGRDYWFTRNGHGVGFWDREELEADKLGDKLTSACCYRDVPVFFGDHVEFGDASFVHVVL